MQFIRKIKERFEIFGILPTIKYLFFYVFLKKFGFQIVGIFTFQEGDFSFPIGEKFTFRVIQSLSELSEKDRASLVEYGGVALINDFSISFARDEFCSLGYWEQRLGCVCWGKKLQYHAVIGRQPAFLIWRCFTLPDLRGRRLYPQTLFSFSSMLKKQELISGPILIESSIFNQSSLKGIQKAGFRYKGKILRFGSLSKTFTVKNS